MNVTREERVPELSEAFYELSLAKEVPDAETLDEVCRNYPQYCAQLTQFAIHLALDALVGDSENIVGAEVSAGRVSPPVSRAISNFHNQLHSAKKAQLVVASEIRSTEATSVPAAVENPFIKLQRQELRALAQRLDVSTVFILKMRDRQIAADTYRIGFVRYIAKELSYPEVLLARHFAAGRERAVPTYHKADGKPSDGGQQTFEDAVSSSGLTDAQQKRLLSL
jgi:hypothetical protein